MTPRWSDTHQPVITRLLQSPPKSEHHDHACFVILAEKRRQIDIVSIHNDRQDRGDVVNNLTFTLNSDRNVPTAQTNG
jgi:hypothetical protein